MSKPKQSKGNMSKLPHDGPEQSKRFLEAARAAEADETEKGADRAFMKVVPVKKRRTPDKATSYSTTLCRSLGSADMEHPRKSRRRSNRQQAA